MASVEGEAGVGDRQVEVLGDLVLVEHLADRDADGVGADERAGVRRGRGSCPEFAAVASSSSLRLWARPPGQCRVAAGDQPLTRVVGVSDLEQVAARRTRHLQGAVVGGRLRDLAARSAVIQPKSVPPSLSSRSARSSRRDHAAIADQHHVCQTELAAHLRRSAVARSAGSAVLPSNTAPPPDGRASRPAAPIRSVARPSCRRGVAARGQLAAPPGHPGAGQIEQRHPRPVHLGTQMACRQLFFDAVLPVGQPVHRGVDLVGGRAGHVKIDAQGRVGPPRQRRQLAGGSDHPRDDQCQPQIPRPARRAQQRRQPQLVGLCRPRPPRAHAASIG